MEYFFVFNAFTLWKIKRKTPEESSAGIIRWQREEPGKYHLRPGNIPLWKQADNGRARDFGQPPAAAPIGRESEPELPSVIAISYATMARDERNPDESLSIQLSLGCARANCNASGVLFRGPLAQVQVPAFGDEDCYGCPVHGGRWKFPLLTSSGCPFFLIMESSFFFFFLYGGYSEDLENPFTSLKLFKSTFLRYLRKNALLKRTTSQHLFTNDW